VRTSPSAARERVFERDRGVCARCCRDTLDLLRRLRNLARRRPRPEVLVEARQLALGFEAAVEVGRRGRVLRIRRTLWQADHILPVAEGGGGCSLENLRTLCLPCHRVVTAELAARLRRIARDGKGDAVSLFLETDAG
jgi:5-methylcytosine-specific restriction endonuclease McrA